MAKMQEFKCPCCGGSIEFDSSVQKMKCPFCDTEFDDRDDYRNMPRLWRKSSLRDMSWSDGGRQ